MLPATVTRCLELPLRLVGLGFGAETDCWGSFSNWAEVEPRGHVSNSMRRANIS